MPCPVCQIPLSTANHETCPSPACPCYGLRSDSAEAERAATRWRSRPSVAARRCMSGETAVQQLETRAWLDMTEAVGELLDIEIEHRGKP